MAGPGSWEDEDSLSLLSAGKGVTDQRKPSSAAYCQLDSWFSLIFKYFVFLLLIVNAEHAHYKK